MRSIIAIESISVQCNTKHRPKCTVLPQTSLYKMSHRNQGGQSFIPQTHACCYPDIKGNIIVKCQLYPASEFDASVYADVVSLHSFSPHIEEE